MCFNKVEGPKTLKRHTLVKNSITQITEYFIKKIGKIFKESEKLYETEGLPSPNAIGTLQKTGRSHLYKKFSNFSVTGLEPVVRRPIYFYKKMWYYNYGD